MCKIDFLGAGLCKSGAEKHYVSFYPQGRMDLYAALAENRIPVTEKCVEIAESCDLCGLCDYQCYFVTEMKPSIVMQALKEHVSHHLNNGGAVVTEEKNGILDGLKEIVGDAWATSDRAVALTYAHDPCPVAEPRMPEYIIMPGSTVEISAVVKLLMKRNVPYAVRGNGSSVMGFVMSEGAVIDLGRMKTIDFDEKNWLVKVGPGVSAFDLQKAAVKRGFRVNAAEPAALVCANIMCSGIFSTFSASYGTAADNYIDAEFVGHDGGVFRLSDTSAPNLFAFKKEDSVIPGICTAAYIRLHPVTSDEGAALVPFESLERALHFAKECAMRRIGLAIGVLGGEYISAFLSPTKKLAVEVRNAFKDKLKIEYVVLVIGDKYALHSIKAMGYKYFDNRLIRTLNLGLPSLASAQWLDLIDELSGEERFSYLGLRHFHDLAEAALAPSPAQLVRDVDPELRPFYEKLYSRPEMTDPVWLSMFRIISSRMGREKHVLAMVVYLPIDNKLIAEIDREFRRIARGHGLKNDFGFITPLDDGKRCVFEYDYYLDHNDPVERMKTQQAMMEAGVMIERYSAETGTVTWIRDVFRQGFSRKESFLYSTVGAD
ncbi:MAG: FAD-dependent oxidoreductase [Candidatus Eisenbacteria bacterium]|uniref:FAD-dependent oxidoreductase n=1 Tax=Eiseniibacteriota bacterium TaxID=2212470 RepID=A0A948RT89_UNCEI|nr:FAD-dependent oxidoreductase [Candidatus Eisenbacteria bacterium]MBU2689324.1 FAD-dependent oxidoreductase [Candidatus Eisenbacteria bacterium]